MDQLIQKPSGIQVPEKITENESTITPKKNNSLSKVGAITLLNSIIAVLLFGFLSFVFFIMVFLPSPVSTQKDPHEYAHAIQNTGLLIAFSIVFLSELFITYKVIKKTRNNTEISYGYLVFSYFLSPIFAYGCLWLVGIMAYSAN